MRKIFYVIGGVLGLLCVWNCNLLVYGIRQGWGQAGILWKSVPVEKVLQDSLFPDSLKKKLILIQEVKRFAEDSFGFNRTENYTTFYNQHHRPLLWVVTACPYFSLEEYKWYFPFVGKVGYIGFFKKKLAEKEAEKLREKHYDVAIDEVNAWSTLGWFKDPVLSSMLLKSEGELSNLIIHELTHTTVYFKGNNDLSENLATFIAHEGAKIFLTDKYGQSSKQYQSYIWWHEDVNKFSRHILWGAERLDSLYHDKTFLKQDSTGKWYLKKRLIREILRQTDTLQLHYPERFQNLLAKIDRINNAFFAGFKMYRAEQKEIDSIYRNRCQSSIRQLIEYYQAQNAE